MAEGLVAREIEVKTNWSNILDKHVPTLTARQIDGHEVWLVDGLFSEAECATLLEEAEMHGFGTTNYPKSYRGNLRLTTVDPNLANVVWQRLQPLVPSVLTVGKSDDEWHAIGLNECWRLAKYHPGDVFKGHCDACFTRVRDVEESMLTVNIYMNGGFEGGSTRFYFNDHDKADFSVTPKPGLCLLFRQPPGQAYYHDGEQLRSGLKYLFRSDVMYRKATAAKGGEKLQETEKPTTIAGSKLAAAAAAAAQAGLQLRQRRVD